MLRKRLVPVLLMTALLLWLGNGLVLAQTKISPQKEAPGGPAFTYLGEYTNMQFTEEHAYGYSVLLWRDGAALVGMLEYSEGLAGDTPAGLLDNVSYDQKTGRISFRAKLTIGIHSCKDHKDVPSRDAFEFRGILAQTRLAGTFARTDALHPEQPSQPEQVTLRKKKGASYLEARTREEWNRLVQEVLKFRGPKW